MNKESDIGIVFNRQAGDRRILEKVANLQAFLAGAKAYDLCDLENGKIPNIPEKLLLVGGDGTIRACVSWLATHDERPLLIVAGGGTGNALKTTLVEEKATALLGKIQDSEELNIRAIKYKPAVIIENGENHYFVVAAGFGSFEKHWAIEREKMRKIRIPNFMKLYMPGVLGTFSLMQSREEYILHLYTINSMIGPLRALSSKELSLKETMLGLLTIQDKDQLKAIAKLFLVFLLWRAKIAPPKSLVSKEFKDVFYKEFMDGDSSEVSVDGDIKNISNGKLIIRRDKSEFLVVALSSKGI